VNDSPLIFESPEQLAQHLFLVFVMDDKSNFLVRFDFSALAGVDQREYERQIFIYLVGIIALAFTDAPSKDQRFVAALSHLRHRVRAEMRNRWNDTNDAADSAVEDAAQDCAHLIFTDPSEDRALSFTWPQQWLKKSGVDVVNPVTLFRISDAWKQAYLTVAEVASRAQFET
jgi:hypothetical protein